MKAITTFEQQLPARELSDYNKVKLFYAGMIEDEDLSDELLRKIEMWKEAYSKLLDPNYSDSRVVQYLLDRFPDISRATAYRYIKIAKRIFEYNDIANRQFDMTFIRENQKRALAMAYANNDPGTATRVLREMRLSLGEEEDSQLGLILSYLDEKKSIKFTVDPKDIGLKKYSDEEIARLFQKAKDSIQDNIVDVPHTMVKDEEKG